MLEPALVEGSVLADESEIKKVLVLLNPVANGGYATKTYERYAKPVFDCAGYQVTLKKTEYVKHERDIAMEISPEERVSTLYKFCQKRTFLNPFSTT